MTLSVNHVSFERHYKFLFKEINCDLKPSEILQIRGANGSGKSTLLRILAGLLEPHSGKILWNGSSIFQEPEHYRTQIHYVGHLNGIKNYLTVYENLKLMSSLMHFSPDINHLTNIMHQVKLHQLMNTQAIRLSAGQKRRLALTRLLLNPLPLWILDEPYSGLDDEGQHFLMTMMEHHLKNNGFIIIATHQVLPINGKLIKLD